MFIFGCEVHTVCAKMWSTIFVSNVSVGVTDRIGFRVRITATIVLKMSLISYVLNADIGR